MSKKGILVIPFLFVCLWGEPSAFQAGDLDSSSPYGLSQTETAIWKNKQKIKKLNRLLLQQQKIIEKQQKTIEKQQKMIEEEQKLIKKHQKNYRQV